METLQIGKAKLTWLNGGDNHLDGGAMFGVVPKALWRRKYPANDKNQIAMRTDPILLELHHKYYLIDTGLGNDKLSDKQRRNFGVQEESQVERDLQMLGLTTDDIDYLLMTHLHFDHACGLTVKQGDTYKPVFKNATIITSDVEWHEMRNPNIRSINTYWKKNWEAIVQNVYAFTREIKLTDELRMIHTGGHSDGHCILIYEDGQDCFIHMADIMATHAHQNKLWAMAYDDYPVTSVHEKEKWMAYGYEKEAWYTFYHDTYYRAIRFNQDGKQTDALMRTKQ